MKPAAAVGPKVWAVGACLLALALVQVASASGASLGVPGPAARALLVLSLLCGAAVLVWRKASAAPRTRATEPALQVVERTTLGPRHGLALVEADGVRVLVAFGDGFAQALSLEPPSRDLRSAP